jgi:light-regulated signal transduction histidine kinase (bacteriophytochrome)
MPDSPAFGQADLTNCERELIHLAGSVQPHGVLLVLREPDRCLLQCSGNVALLLGRPASDCLERPLSCLGGNLDGAVADLAARRDLAQPQPLAASTGDGATQRFFEGWLHRAMPGLLVVELEPLATPPGLPQPVALDDDVLHAVLERAVRRFSDAASQAALADAAARSVRELTGYDRVMVYRFDPEGHGKIIAEAREPRLESLLGHHYPSTDIPQRARELYVRMRVRVLVDTAYVPAPLQPARNPELDMSLCTLRSMSPLHIQYLKNMGVTATLVISLVRGGQLWGLIAAHHDSPRNLRQPLRTACELLAEVMTTRLAAIENYVHAQVGLLVRRLEQRLVEATSTDGDWRMALLRHPQTLLQPLEASGAVLFHDDEILSTGDVPSTPELRALRDWVHAQPGPWPLACHALARANPALAGLTPMASGVLAVRLSGTRPDLLVWLRKEQLQTVTWAGDPTKPVLGNDPLELSPRRSFEAWSERVRGSALPWTATELALARAIGGALVDIVVQVHAVRLLIAEHQLTRTRATITNSRQPVLICNGDGRPLLANTAFETLCGCNAAALPDWAAVAALFTAPSLVAALRTTLRHAHQPWRGELALQQGSGTPLPVGLRAEVVPSRDGGVLGIILTLDDRSEAQRAVAARAVLERSLAQAARPVADLRLDGDAVMQSILTHARLAALDIADASADAPMAPVLDELTASTRRAAELYGWIRRP